MVIVGCAFDCSIKNFLGLCNDKVGSYEKFINFGCHRATFWEFEKIGCFFTFRTMFLKSYSCKRNYIHRGPMEIYPVHTTAAPSLFLWLCKENEEKYKTLSHIRVLHPKNM